MQVKTNHVAAMMTEFSSCQFQAYMGVVTHAVWLQVQCCSTQTRNVHRLSAGDKSIVMGNECSCPCLLLR